MTARCRLSFGRGQELKPFFLLNSDTATLNLARQHNLAAYDAAYLELAMRERLLLATIDQRLANAAQYLNILLEDPN